jgi:AcrR family transcriptional regulator
MSRSEPAKPPRPSGPAKAVGLRERKKQKTREAIQRAAVRLFSKQGYEETTIEEIAAAVEISPSTFFNYFPTKEDVVMMEAYDPIAMELFLQRPKDEPLQVAFGRVLEGIGGLMQRDRDLILARTKLMFGEPALRARVWDELGRTQAAFIPVLAERTGRSPNDFEVRVITRMFISALYEAGLEWIRNEGRGNLVDYYRRAIDIIERGALLDQPGRAKPRG